MTDEEFIAAYPQFEAAGDLITQALADATPRVDDEVFGDLTDFAIGLLAADWLVCSPYGQSMRSDDDSEKKSRYRKQFEELRRERVVAFVVT